MGQKVPFFDFSGDFRPFRRSCAYGYHSKWDVSTPLCRPSSVEENDASQSKFVQWESVFIRVRAGLVYRIFAGLTDLRDHVSSFARPIFEQSVKQARGVYRLTVGVACCTLSRNRISTAKAGKQPRVADNGRIASQSVRRESGWTLGVCGGGRRPPPPQNIFLNNIFN